MLDSLIGYTLGALIEDSLIGFSAGLLVDPGMVGVAYLALGEWG